MVALSYSILATGLTTKAARFLSEDGKTLPDKYQGVILFNHYGILLAVVIVCWAMFCAYHSSTFSKMNLDEGDIAVSGLILSGIFCVIAISITFAGLNALFYR